MKWNFVVNIVKKKNVDEYLVLVLGYVVFVKDDKKMCVGVFYVFFFWIVNCKMM